MKNETIFASLCYIHNFFLFCGTINLSLSVFTEQQKLLTLRWSSILPLAVDLNQLCVRGFQPGFQRLHPLSVH